ncbi:efflux RND transporter permease subunit [Azospirillum halopraeferens]|uniref:efflux RND transporter permease subunit n=1 Tax=Azospirillum halopraeferens TaxID=34010 RepID=UPI00041CDA4A|nr:MMPL family transporter [Azospirillum halopraeferens]
MTRFIGRLERLVFDNRPLVLALFALATLGLGYATTLLRVDAGFEKLVPVRHEYMQTYFDHPSFGGANRLLIALEARQGDIFTPAFFTALKAATDEVHFLPGVDRPSVTSLFTPNVRYTEIVEDGFAGGNVVPADFTLTPEGLAVVRDNAIKGGHVGRLVANDFSAALVTAQLMERDPETGERLDYLKVAELLESRIRSLESEAVAVRIIGFAKATGDIAAGARGVVMFFGITLVISAVMVYLFAHSVKLALLPLACSAVAVVWQAGLLAVMGFGIDPMSILVPFLVFAIGVSHGVQMVNAVGAEVFDGKDREEAARTAFRRLMLPGAVALLCDAVGFLAVLLIEIRIIQELAIAASVGVGVVIVTNLILLPVLLSYTPLPRGYSDRIHRAAAFKEPMWRFMAVAADRRVAAVLLAGAVVLAGWGVMEGRNLTIGDTDAGVPELRPDSRYNRDTAFIVSAFDLGVDVLTVIVETKPEGCVDPAVMDTVDRLDWRMRNVEGVQTTLSLPRVARTIAAGFNEGNPKWRELPRSASLLVSAVAPVNTGTGLLNADCSVMPVMVFTADHKAETITRVTDAVKAFAAENADAPVRLRLATGNVGVMAATNEAVKSAKTEMLVLVYAVVAGMCLLTFRSLRATVCVCLPLLLVTVLSNAVMSLLGIGLKVSTLPVEALGVGIGVDYGIYIFSRMQGYLREGRPLGDAYLQTLRETGNAVLFTGLTLAVGVATWVFSALKFQADMGLMLGFFFLVSMLSTLLLTPALASWLWPRAAAAPACRVPARA